MEYSKLKDYSEYLLSNEFTDINTILNTIRKSRNGYIIYRHNSKNKFIIDLDLIKNQIEIKRSV